MMKMLTAMTGMTGMIGEMRLMWTAREERIFAQLRELARRYDVERLVLFGSYSRSDLAHMYDSARAKALVTEILTRFIPAFEVMRASLRERYGDSFLNG